MDGITGAIEGYNRPGRALLWNRAWQGHNRPEWAQSDGLGLAGIGGPGPEVFIRRPSTCN